MDATDIKLCRDLIFFFCVYYLFICGLFNHAVSSSECIASNQMMINELERIWKESVVA
jgi:hypothetical protein